ncbi:hypothetical protein PYW07_014761 [Mythimna separata]|uniref:FHA domain-containing protein n=1 Tax=Mythimna separata TaxID=271217 RepID=A0AAD7Z2I9_MYTSE|nr:hypothetical protein PYW07_014761 [Mythimna separata]
MVERKQTEAGGRDATTGVRDTRASGRDVASSGRGAASARDVAALGREASVSRRDVAAAGAGSDAAARRHLQVLYAAQTREKQIFISDLKDYRKRKDRQLINAMIESIGPKWYQALSVRQRCALDSLKMAMYQDVLEGRPVRCIVIMYELGLVPLPNFTELMSCVLLGREDPKEMLAQLYFSTYGYPINGKRISYCLNARLILSAILYLGLNNLIFLLEKTFAPDKVVGQPKPKPKRKPPVKLPSPYLAKMVAICYEPPRIRHKPPPPLPDLTALNEPYEEEPIMQKPPPPPPPPPPPKKRIPIQYCEQLAGMYTILPHIPSPTNVSLNKKSFRSRGRRSKINILEGTTKKKYGIGIDFSKRNKRRKKLVPPTTSLWNAQYTINGVIQVQGKTCFILGNVTILPALGELIHGGYTYVNGQLINIHCGIRGRPPAHKPDPCDCVKQWQDAVFKYIKNTKCDCGHHFDLYNEGRFSQEELPYFIKPTGHVPFQFNYDTIYDLDKEKLYIEKEFKKIWDTDSMLRVSDSYANKLLEAKKKKKKKDKDAKKDGDEDDGSKVRNVTSQVCLGLDPKITDYLKCALRLMRKVNVAARLPDLHLVPELKEWMRQRLYGKLKAHEKKEYLRKSTTYWSLLRTLADQGFGHVSPPKEPIYGRPTTWTYKQSLNDSFRKYTDRYRLMMFRSHAYVTNMLWSTMFQAEFPDKKFREIYFSYLFSRVQDIQLIHPYSKKETTERTTTLMNKRYVCLPEGCES